MLGGGRKILSNFGHQGNSPQAQFAAPKLVARASGRATNPPIHSTELECKIGHL
jgi:hypothetical protein